MINFLKRLFRREPTVLVSEIHGEGDDRRAVFKYVPISELSKSELEGYRNALAVDKTVRGYQKLIKRLDAVEVVANKIKARRKRNED